MKLRKSGRGILAAVSSLAVSLGLTSCGTSNTVDIVFVTATKNNPGQIYVYYTDSESGALSQIKDSPFPSGGRNPVAEIVSPDYKYLYVANRDDNNIVQFGIGTDGKLYQNQTCNTPGSSPLSLAISPDGTKLYVLDDYSPITPGGPVYSSANPGPGALAVFPVSVDSSAKTDTLSCTPIPQTFVDSNNATQTASYVPVGISPTGVALKPDGSTVFVTAQNGLPNGTNTSGLLYSFNSDSNGALTTAPGSPYQAGTAPSAVAVEPRGGYLYVTDSRQNQILVWTILSTGELAPNQNGPYKTDTTPVAMAVDPRGLYLYVSNFTSGDISAFAISQSTGTLSALSGATSYQTGAGSSCILVDPALGRFVYTANFNDDSVSGLTLAYNTGVLSKNQNSPYPTAGQPACVAAIPHGNHSTQHVQGVGN